jgi:hypothetical protein
MSDADQSGASQAAAPDESGGYDVVPFAERDDQEELYGYRASLNPADADQPQPTKRSPSRRSSFMLALLVLAAALVALLALPKLFHSKPPAPYIDLENRRLESAGIAGRLVVRWEGSPTYQLFLDPLAPEQTAVFKAVAANPPYPLTVTIQLENATGRAACRKEIVLPAPGQPFAPRKNASGDTVENIAGADGQIAEIQASGPLPCSLKAYRSLAAWSLASNFPALDKQRKWREHADDEAAQAKAAKSAHRNAAAQPEHLASPIEGDDTIVGDNPARGVVETGAGRVFWVGVNRPRFTSAATKILSARSPAPTAAPRFKPGC